jgi:hypothetical protein
MVRTEVGVDGKAGWELASGTLLIRGRGSYVYKALLHTGRISAAIVGVPSSFTVEALTGHQNLGLGSVELSWQSFKGSYVSALYTGQFGSGYASNEITARLGKRF